MRLSSVFGISSLLVLFAMGCPGQEAGKSIGDSQGWKVVAASDLSLAELLARHAEALGGEEALAALVTVKKEGKLNSRAGSDLPVTNILRHPDRYYWLVTGVDGDSFIQVVHDGEVGWELSPKIGYDVPTPRSEIEQLQLKHNADPTGPLVSPQEKGYTVEVQGKTEKNAYRLRVDFNDGTERFYLLDPETFLATRFLETRSIQGRLTAESEVFMRDFREVGGVKFAFFEEVTLPAVGFQQTVFWESIEPNVEIDDSKFSMD